MHVVENDKMETFISHAHAYFEFESCLLNHILSIHYRTY